MERLKRIVVGLRDSFGPNNKKKLIFLFFLYVWSLWQENLVEVYLK